MIQLLQRNVFWVSISFITLFLYLFPLIYYGENLYIRVHDYLDITVPTLKILAHSGMIFAPSMEIVPNMMGGLPRLVYGSEFNYLLWLFFFFKPFTAIVINEIMIHCIAYLSMIMLLQHILRNDKIHFKLAVIHLTSLLFALTPFFPATGLGVALLPYSLFLFFKIRLAKDTLIDWFILFLIPFLSNFILIYFFFLISITVLFLGEMIYKKQINLRLIFAIGFMCAVFLGIEYRLIAQMVMGNDFVSHRVEFQRKCVNFMDFYRGMHNVLLFGQSHSLNLQFPYLLAIINLAFIMTWVKRHTHVIVSMLIISMFTFLVFSDFLENFLMSKYYVPTAFIITLIALIRSHQYRFFYATILMTIIFSAWYALWYYKTWCYLSQQIHFFQIFDFSRFVLLLTPIWYLLAAWSFLIIFKKLPYGWILVGSIVTAQFVFLSESVPFFQNSKGLTYKTFYDEALFEEIKEYIGESPSSYRVAGLGIYPAILLYNGLYTLDGYAPNYPLEYKHQFSVLVRENFIHNENSRRFIESWGSKCYLIAGNRDYDEYESNAVIENFYLDAVLFRKMGGRFIVSGYKIRHDHSRHLRLRHTFYSQDGYWVVYLYEVVSSLNEN